MRVLCGLWMLLFYIFPVQGQENSTQMLYFLLDVEEGAINNITEKLLHQDYHHDDFILSDITMTTECDVVLKPDSDSDSDLQRTCVCSEGFEWSPASCSESNCCRNNTCKNPLYHCSSKRTVLLKGSLSLNISYQSCLGDVNTKKYKSCHKTVTKKIMSVFSLIYGFDSLRITHYRVGSVVADFEVVVVSDVTPSIVRDISEKLTQELNATLSLETTGIVQLQVPPGPLKQDSSTDLYCSFAGFSDGSSLVQQWKLLNNKTKTKDIYNGTESTITTTITNSTMETRVSLTPLSHHWTGTYSCSFLQGAPGVLIRHSASSHMVVCVSPLVSIRTDPQFPRCSTTGGLLLLTVSCEIPYTYEHFNVSWDKENIETAVLPQQERREPGVLVFSAQTFVDCGSSQPKLTCRLKNRCDQETEATAEVLYLRDGDRFCSSEGVWEDTPVGQTAVVRCSSSVGTRTRLCNVHSAWDEERTNCVDLVLQEVLDNAIVSDIGLGRLEQNADDVFEMLQTVTNDTKAFNSAPNLQTSVTVIHTMSSKLGQLSNQTTVNNFLLSASNLLEKPLAGSWALSSKNNTKTALAAEYLIAVEHLIHNTNVTRRESHRNLQVESCPAGTASCCNKVFNNTVFASAGRAASIKTTGFLNLANFLPNDHEPGYSLNSIVLSTTARAEGEAAGGAGKAQGGAQGGTDVGEVDIIIDFALIGQRPRNYKLRCVFWDTNSSQWSAEGCELQSEGRCRCRHLSSFAMLMSKAPLEVPYLSQITYAGLSVSIVSLVAFLVVELVIWRDVVKTDTLHLRHCAHVHISVCLLVADVCFLSAALPGELSAVWALTFVVLQHFCYLAMFFWTLCLSCALLHKTVYVSLRGAGRTAYMRFSLLLGYVCPLLIVVVTFLANNGAEGRYYSKETRWLVYGGLFKGSIFTFIIPVCVIVFINLFFMVLVILKLLQSAAAQHTADPEKNSVKTVIRSVVLLTPVFGLTWAFGFLMILFDLTAGPAAYAANYLFTIMNAFQGLYIFLTTCLCDRMVRDGLRRYFSKKSAEKSSISSSVSQPSLKKK